MRDNILQLSSLATWNRTVISWRKFCLRKIRCCEVLVASISIELKHMKREPVVCFGILQAFVFPRSALSAYMPLKTTENKRMKPEKNIPFSNIDQGDQQCSSWYSRITSNAVLVPLCVHWLTLVLFVFMRVCLLVHAPSISGFSGNCWKSSAHSLRRSAAMVASWSVSSTSKSQLFSLSMFLRMPIE